MKKTQRNFLCVFLLKSMVKTVKKDIVFPRIYYNLSNLVSLLNFPLTAALFCMIINTVVFFIMSSIRKKPGFKQNRQKKNGKRINKTRKSESSIFIFYIMAIHKKNLKLLDKENYFGGILSWQRKKSAF